MARRISIRKIIQTLVTFVAVTGCALAMISADRQASRRKVKGVDMVVHSPSGVRFLTEDAVRTMLFNGRHIQPERMALAKLDERSMEAILRSNPWVKDAQVYTDAERMMHISVTQRVPLVRLFEEDGNSYYVDAELKTMPLSTQYTHYVPVVTGVAKLGLDSAAAVVKGTIVGLVRRIGRDTFWNAQVSQIDMRADGGFELVPVLGKQRIIIGDTARLQEKLDNLFAFYKQVQNKVGWDKYNTLDLRYEGQVVASPSLPWKAPVDRAISNMNWLNAIMENAPKNAAQLGGDAAAADDGINPAAPQISAPVPVPDKPPAAVPAPPPVAKPVPQAARRLPKPALPAPAKPKPKPLNKPATKNTSRHNQTNAVHAATKR